VEAGGHVGPGVKYRILEMFRELAASTTEAASKPTEATLLSHYQVIEKEIRKAFGEWGDPLESTVNAIAERHEDRTKRSDSQKRKQVLSAIEQIRGDAPLMSELFTGSIPELASQ
jgi:sigma54-dependent transcription regulator